jgi:urease accessory protein
VVGSTKIFKRKATSHHTRQTMTVMLQPHAALALLPDPIQPFRDSAYSQHQVFKLPADDSASLVVLDWVCEGRSARGEHWDLHSFTSRNEFFLPRDEGRPDRLMLRDSLVLTQDAQGLRVRMDGFTVFATLVVRGPKFVGLAEALLNRFSEEPRIGGRNFDNRVDFKNDKAKKGGVIWTATKHRGFVLVKVSGKELEEVKVFLRELLMSGGESDLVREFGEGALLCLQ